MAQHQTETTTLAAQLAAKRTGGNKRKRTQTLHHHPNKQELTGDKTRKTGDQAPAGAKHKDTTEEETSTETIKRKETQETHSYTQQKETSP